MSTKIQRKPKVLSLMPFQAGEDTYLTNFKSQFILDVGIEVYFDMISVADSYYRSWKLQITKRPRQLSKHTLQNPDPTTPSSFSTAPSSMSPSLTSFYLLFCLTAKL